MRWSALVSVTVCMLPACDRGGEVAIDEIESVSSEEVALGDPIPGLDPELLERFEEGTEEFAELEEIDEGLGPVFNDLGCASCHDAPAVGGSGLTTVTRFGSMADDGVFDPMEYAGGSLIQVQGFGAVGNCDVAGELVPAEANRSAHRRTTALFGLGFVDAVPDDVFVQLAALERSHDPATAGKVSYVTDPETGDTVVGRFGWKAQVSSLHVFSGDAYLNEMGITNPIFPEENCPQGDCSRLIDCDPVADPEDDGEGVEAFTDFMSLLAAPPTPRSLTSQARVGSLLFLSAGCAGCHTPVLATGDSEVAQLDHTVFFPFSDFLLHDMGGLGDGITQGGATDREMRTAPLWGVSAQQSFLHDGRAATLADAILAHDGQGRAARDRFAGLSSTNKARLVAFLEAL